MSGRWGEEEKSSQEKNQCLGILGLHEQNSSNNSFDGYSCLANRINKILAFVQLYQLEATENSQMIYLTITFF